MTALVLIAALLIWLPWIAFGLSALATLLHTAEETFGEGGPIWRYLLGPHVPTWAGALGLVAFAALNVALAYGGYVLHCPHALVALLLIRLLDCVASHWIPHLLGRRPNPGILTTPYYVVESAAVGAWVIL